METRLSIDERGSRIARNSVFDCHAGDKRQSKTPFLTMFLSTFVDSINVLDCRLSGVRFGYCNFTYLKKTEKVKQQLTLSYIVLTIAKLKN